MMQCETAGRARIELNGVYLRVQSRSISLYDHVHVRQTRVLSSPPRSSLSLYSMFLEVILDSIGSANYMIFQG